MKSTALILASLASIATASAMRVHGYCQIIVDKSKANRESRMWCEANLPNGQLRRIDDTARGDFPKVCSYDGVVCWQMNINEPKNIDIFYANKVQWATGHVTGYNSNNVNAVWRNKYDVTM